MDSLVSSLTALCTELGFNKTYWVAYSGGVDSHVLLHALTLIRAVTPFELKAIHVNHGLSPSASAWDRHVKAMCAGLQVECVSLTMDFPLPSKNLEEIARERRYVLLQQCLSPNDLLLTGHHQDDQAETVLLQLLRGAGPKGLSAMPRIKPFGSGFLVRPLLESTRSQLEQYAVRHGLQWIEDESNKNPAFFRNFLRHTILPLFKERLPSVTETLARVAAHCAEYEKILSISLHEKYQQVLGSVKGTLSVTKLLNLSEPYQRHVIRHWLAEHHFPMPSAVKMQHILQDVLRAKKDKCPCIKWADVAIRRYRDNIYAMHSLLPLPKSPMTLTGFEMVPLPENIPLEETEMRFRVGGETIRLKGEPFHRDLKKLFQQWGVPPWLRNQVPLLYFKEELVAVLWVPEKNKI